MHPETLTPNAGALVPGLSRFSDFYLAGGTALALQIGHRISVDFDFFSAEPIEKGLLPKLKRAFPNEKVIPAVNNPDELTAMANGVKITFLHYPFPPRQRLTEYEKIKLLGVKEIAAAKAYTVGRRGEYKDYIDLYFILRGNHSTLKEIIELANEKYGAEFNDRLFLEQLAYDEDIIEAPIQFLKTPVARSEIARLLEEEIRGIAL